MATKKANKAQSKAQSKAPESYHSTHRTINTRALRTLKALVAAHEWPHVCDVAGVSQSTVLRAVKGGKVRNYSADTIEQRLAS